MSFRSQLNAQDGFTVQELMVVLVVGSLLVTFSFSLFLFTSKLFSSWHKRTELRSEVSRVLQLIASDVNRSKQILALTDSTLTLATPSAAEITYRVQEHRIWRNHVQVGSEATDYGLHLTPIKNSASDPYPEGVGISLSGQMKSMMFKAETRVTILQNAREHFLSTSN